MLKYLSGSQPFAGFCPSRLFREAKAYLLGQAAAVSQAALGSARPVSAWQGPGAFNALKAERGPEAPSSLPCGMLERCGLARDFGLNDKEAPNKASSS